MLPYRFGRWAREETLAEFWAGVQTTARHETKLTVPSAR
jgi:hypothetical protein